MKPGWGLQYLAKRSVSVSPWGGGAARRGRGDLTVGALLPRLLRHRGEKCVAAAGCHLTTHTHRTSNAHSKRSRYRKREANQTENVQI